MSNNKGIIIGIDLGTTNSCMAYKRSGEEKCTVIPNAGGYLTTPSYIFFDKNTSEELVGQAAKRQSTSGNCIYESKRLIGRQFDDPEINNIKKLLNFSIVKASNGEAYISVNNKQYSPVEIAAKILRKLKQDAEAFLNEPVTRAVITVPAYFNDAQRQATKDAGEIAGLKVERIVNEPTAAALAYGFDKEINQKIAVYDLGGGTFDISILSIEDGTFEVLSTNGNTLLGGADFDQEIIKYLIQDFEMKNNLKIDQNNVSLLQRFKDEAEKAKIELSSSATYTVTMPYLMQHNGNLLNYETNLTRAKLEQLTIKLVEKSLEPCKLALKDAGLTARDLHAVVLVGGMTRMPLVQTKVKEFFNKELFKGVNPDEVVALGAAIQGAILRGDVDGVILLDVTPLTLGIETAGGVMTAIIERNSTIPCKKSQVFSTAADNQTQVGISVYQGERPMAADNNLLGTFVLDGIVPAKRGVPQIEVSFDIDANGILNVSAKDKGTNKEQAIKIQSSGGLTKDQIEKMKKEAEENSQKDKERAELVLAKNEAEQLVFNTEDHMKEYGSKISEEDQKNINDSIEKLKELSKSENIDEIKAAIDELKKHSMKLGEAMYKESKNAKSESEETTETQGQ